MRSAIPSSTTQIRFTISPQALPYLIPQGYQIGTSAIDSNGNYIHFETDQDLTIPIGSVTGIVSATQGFTISNESIGASNGKPNQKFILEYRKAIDDYFSGTVDENGILTTWTEVDTFAEVSDDNVFITEIDELDRTYIIFGDGINGRIPPQGCQIYMTYKTGGGVSTNVGIGSIVENKGNLVSIIGVTNLVAATGGQDRETIASAKLNAPLHFKTSERAVTSDDFKALCLRNTDVQRAVAISSTAGIVQVYIASVADDGVPTAGLKNTILAYLNERRVITFVITMRDPYFVPVDISLSATIRDDINQSDAEAAIISLLDSHCSYSSRDFGEGVRLGEIYRDILLMDEIEYAEITQFTTKPIVYPQTQSASPVHTFDIVEILSANNVVGEWRVIMTDASHFNVDLYDEATASWVNQGSGEIGVEFTSSGGEIKFTIVSNGGTSQIDDYWLFYTNKYLGNITNIQSYEILHPPFAPNTYTITLSGGIP